MKIGKKLIFGLFAIIVGIVLLLQFVHVVVQEVQLQGIGLILEPYNGELHTTEIQYALGTPITDLPEPTLDGFEFNGWYTDEDLSSPIEPGDRVNERTVLYAKYTTINYTIQYMNGDVLVYEETYPYDGEITLFTNLEKLGYTFNDWYIDTELINLFNLTRMPSENVVLYSEWSINQYTLLFDSNGGTSISPITQDYNTTILQPSNPTIEGYTFNGWYLDAEFESSFSFYTMLPRNTTIYAQWEINNRSITFHENGGSYVINPFYDYNESIVLPTQLLREGYTFNAWFLDEALSQEFNYENMPDTDLDLYASWSINQYTINFEENGGAEISSITTDYGDEITIPSTPLRTGYNFGGWYTNPELSNLFLSNTMPGRDVTLYAKWLQNEYKLEFIDYDGFVIQSINYAFNTDLSSISLPSNPIREGHTFFGWDSVMPNNMPASNIIIQAMYTINNYTIYYRDFDGTIIESYGYEYGSDLSEIVIPTNPSRIGYVFTEWDNIPPLAMPANDIDLTAEYAANSYTLTFIDYDNSILQELVIDYDEDLTGITGPTIPDRVGYSFLSWDKALPTNMPVGDIILQAIYTVVKYTITFDSNGGSEASPLTSQEGQAIFAPVEPTKLGYVFDGWFVNSDLANEFEFLTTPPRDITLYAKWINDSFDVIYQDYNGSVLKTETHVFDSDISGILAPSNPTRVGFTFDAWSIALLTTMPANNLIIVAEYIVNSYTLEYQDYDGTVIQTATYDYGDDLSALAPPSNPSRAGYTFSVWDQEPSSTMPASNVVITATYLINQYTIDFVSNGGTLLSNITDDYNVVLIEPTEPTKLGYTFSGWFSDANFTNEFIFDNMPSEDVTLYAKWNVNQYDMDLDSNGGSAIVTITQDYNTVVTQPADPTRTGYTFSGWFSDAILTQSYTFTIIPAEDINLYAKWTINSYTLEYVDWDGTILQTDVYNYNVDISAVTEPTASTRTGYTFTGWDTLLPANMPANNLVITAVYSVNIYTLEYQDYDATVLKSETYNYSSDLSSVLSPTDPERVGYTFIGWDISVPGTMPNSNVVITATYSINQYTIDFVSNGGTLVSNITDDYDAVLIEPTGPTKLGYTFDGWFSDANFTNEFIFDNMPSEDVTLYAKWNVNQYDMDLDSNGGSAVITITQDYNTAVTQPADPTRIGYTFSGWFSDALFTQSYTFTTIPAEDITLYAKWTINSYTLEYVDWDGTSLQTDPYNYDVDISGVTEPTTPTRTGYTFTGWNTLLPANMPANDITVTAEYTVNSYILEYVDWNGIVLQTSSYDYGVDLTGVTAPIDPTRIGYTFSGWDTLVPTSMPASSITITAQYTINAYTLEFLDYDGTVLLTNPHNYGEDLSGVSAPADPTRTSYLFTGWDSLVPATMPAGDVTIIAEYTINSYTLEYHDYDGTILFTNSYDYGEDLTGIAVPSNPTRIGYTFSGWDILLPATMPSNDLTITATYTINQYTLEYVDWDGSVIQTAPYNYSADLSIVSAPVDPIRTGYTFSGWDSIKPANMPASDVIITAGYTVNSYTLEYVDWDDSVLQTDPYNYGVDLTGVIAPIDPTRSGYTFTGWDTLVPSTMPANTVTIKAEYSINEYTISFNANGGSSVTAITQDFATVVLAPGDPTKAGYDFAGWYSDALLTLTYTFTTMPAEDITLYAEWNVNQYDITFNSNGGSAVVTITQDYNTSVIQPADPARTGYTFSGWFSDTLLTQSYTFTTMPAEDITLYAKWTINSYTLEYQDYDGSVIQTAPYNYSADLSVVSAPADPIRTGYTFSGWDIVKPTNMPASDVIITAEYTVNSYTLEYVDWDDSVLQTDTYNYEVDLTGVTAPVDPTRTGYTFIGWDTLVPSTMPANIVTIKAEYSINEYTISFNANGGSSVTAITQDFATVVLAPGDPTKAGYDFAGWYSDALLTLTYTFTTMPAEDITLYAEWNVNQYDITFNSNGGSAVVTITQDYNTSVIQPADPARTGYTFSGWFSDTLLTQSYTFTTMPAEDITLYAKWTINSYTLEYQDYDGSVIQTAPYNYNADLSVVSAPTNPSRIGYTFSGWDIVKPTNMPANDLTITAIYTINTYTLKFFDYDASVISGNTYNYGANLSSVTNPNDPTRIGYSFTGWSASVPATMPNSNVTITAQYTINPYTISFESNGGSAVTAITQNYATSVLAPSTPTKTGYTFGGWYSDAALTSGYTFTTMPANDITLYAKWDVSEYTITFNSNGGTTVTAITQNYLTAVEAPTEPTKTSNNFGGWFTDIGLTTEYSFGTMPANSFTLYAKWNASDYTMSFDTNGGSAIASITQAAGTVVSAPGNPLKTGYAFGGWYSDIALSSSYSFTTMPSNNIILYAKWTINQYTISFNSNGGSSVTAIIQDYDTAVSQPANPTRSGYIFSGWFSDTLLTTPYTFTTMPAGSITVYAKWVVNNSTISFNSNGGTSVSDITQQATTSVSQPSDPSKTGYTFAGWYEDYDLINGYTFTTMPDDDITLYADWTVISYALVYEDWEGTELKSTSYNYGADLSSATAPVDPTRTGYTFTGWDSLVPATMPSNIVTITATYTINQYTLEYIDWDGQVLQTADFDYDIALSSVTAPSDPTRPGYTFSGWDIVKPTNMPANNVTITAVYSIIQYTITFDSNEGSSVTAITQDYNTSVNQPTDPTRAGYTFAGWYSDSGLNTPYAFTTMPANSFTLYAKWTVNEYNISFNSNGGTAITTITQNFDTAVSAPTDPTRTGYAFGGWYSDAALTSSYTFTTMPSADITLYANWNVNSYTLEFLDWDNSVLQSTSYNFGADLSSVTEPSDPTRTGYSFNIWDSSIPATMPASNVALTATYTINTYTLEYVDWDGQVLQTADYNYNADLALVTAPSNPTRTGYTFTGWDSLVPSNMPANKVTITAEYTVNSYTLEYVDWDDLVLQTAIYNYGVDLTGETAPVDPTRTGYTFTGWDVLLPSIMPANDVTLVAQYTINQYTISFNSNGGTAVVAITQNFDIAVTTPADPIRTGYTFGGWYTDAGLTSTYTFTTMPASNITVYAKWDVLSYTLEYLNWDDSILSSTSKNFGADLSGVIAPQATRTGYTFVGWDTLLPTTMPADNVSLTATYSINTYTLEYVDWEGSVIQTNDYDYNTNLSLVTAPANPTRTGYSFTGWDLAKPVTMPANDYTITAVYSINQYTITFNSNGGTSVTTITQNYDTLINQPANPLRTGYTFDGWYSDIALTVPYTFTTMPASNITLYAKWSVNQYTISFNANGGTAVTAITQDFDTAVTAPTEPIRTGYTFGGWYTDAGLTSAYSFTTIPANNITVYAKWIVDGYTLQFLDWNGSVIQSGTYNFGADLSSLVYPTDPTRIGYTFNIWDSSISATMPASNVTITATYTINSYTLEYVDWDGTIIQTSSHIYNVDLSGVTIPGNPTRVGYTFVSWDTLLPTTMPANDVTITAEYSINQYTISFNTNGGTALTAITQDYETVVSQPANPTRIGYTFAGWYSDAGLTAIYTFTTMPASNIILYAMWTVNQYTISFNSNGGTVVPSITQDFETVVTAPVDPTKTGYTFTGWYTDAGLTIAYTLTTMPGSDITLYAKWNVLQYSLEYRDYDGSLLQTSIHDYGSDLSGVIPPINPTRIGHTFSDWDTTLPTTMPNNNLIIAATYSINSYTLEYVDWDGSILQSGSYNYNADLSGVIAPTTPIRVGYTFSGWDTLLPTNMPASDLTITALYTINQYTITFDGSGGTEVTPITQDYNTVVNQPANPLKTGYTFDGWYSDVALTVPYTFTTMPANNFTLYAKWIVIQYSIEYRDYDGSVLQTDLHDFDSDISGVSAPSNPTRVGYTFSGWDTLLPGTMPNNNIIVTATYTINSYTLEYVGWDSSVLQTTNYNYGSDLTQVLPPISPIRVGYTFTGWSPALPTTMPANDITITAQYTINQYSISFISNGGTAVATITQDYGTTVIAPTNPLRTGYTFDGWYSDVALTVPYTFTTMPVNDVTLYAAWLVAQYTITFDSNGGTAVSPITSQEATTITEPTAPTKTDFYFGGWYTDIALTNEFTFITMPPLNLTLYARWLTSEEAAQEIILDLIDKIAAGDYENLPVNNKKTSTMEAAVTSRTIELQALYPGAIIELINGARSGSTYTFTFLVTVDEFTAILVNVVATFD